MTAYIPQEHEFSHSCILPETNLPQKHFSLLIYTAVHVTLVVLTAVYIPSHADTKLALDKLYKVINRLWEAAFIVAGDFNSTNLRKVRQISTTFQTCDLRTQASNTFDHGCLLSGEERSSPIPLLGYRIMSYILVLPAVRQKLKHDHPALVWPIRVPTMLLFWHYGLGLTQRSDRQQHTCMPGVLTFFIVSIINYYCWLSKQIDRIFLVSKMILEPLRGLLQSWTWTWLSPLMQLDKNAPHVITVLMPRTSDELWKLSRKKLINTDKIEKKTGPQTKTIYGLFLLLCCNRLC